MMSLLKDFDILATLQQAVTAAVAASTAPTTPIKYVDTKGFDPGSDQKYFEIVHIPSNASGDFWGDEKNYYGSIRLLLHWPKNGDGPYVPGAILESVSGYFSKGRLLSGVEISDIPDFTGVIEEDAELIYPVTIRYHSYIS